MIAVFGPTAVGKSRVAVMVAERLAGEIVSVDSMQVYRGLPLLTDQPSPELQARIKHYLIATVPLAEEYSAALYVREARKALADIQRRGRLPLVVGGTGLYLQALMGGFSFAGRADEGTRAKWERFLREEGREAAYGELLRLDARAAALVDRENPRRLVRALEAAESRGASIAAERERLWSGPESIAGGIVITGLERQRGELYAAIDSRVDGMLATGAIDEVREARRGPVSRTAARSIGFSELSEFLDGRLSLEAAAAAIKQRSRRYAKRQLTWMRKMPDIARIDLSGSSTRAAAQTIIELFESLGMNGR